jgi:hypothetical protein
MKIYSTSGNGNFKIQSDNNDLLELEYKNWFSSIASTNLNNRKIEIRPKNFWNSSFDIFHNGKGVGNIIFNWRGDAVITINNEKYLFKAIEWNSKFELLNEKEDKIVLITPNYKWEKKKYDYELEVVTENFDFSRLVELLIYVGFSANLHMTATLRN